MLGDRLSGANVLLLDVFDKHSFTFTIEFRTMVRRSAFILGENSHVLDLKLII